MQLLFIRLVLALGAISSKNQCNLFSNKSIPLKAVNSAVQIFYLQETPIISDPLERPKAALASLAPSFTGATQYTWSAWFYKTTWSNWWEGLFRITLDTTYSTPYL